jgi:hypothetical protein
VYFFTRWMWCHFTAFKYWLDFVIEFVAFVVSVFKSACGFGVSSKLLRILLVISFHVLNKFGEILTRMIK